MSIQNGSQRRQKGYWRLAREYMYSNNHAAIFSRCSDLIIFDLLLMQAELFEARKRFGLPVNGFGSSSDGSSSSLSTATAWTDLLEGGELSKDMKEWCELRPLLRDYRNYLVILLVSHVLIGYREHTAASYTARRTALARTLQPSCCSRRAGQRLRRHAWRGRACLQR